MPVVIPQEIPAFKILDKENVFVMSKNRASTQDIRPIEIAIVNLMPTKIATESQLLRMLANSPLQVNITFVTTQSYESKNTPKSHLKKFYKKFSSLKGTYFDGMIITGAPVEQMAYEDVAYWAEMQDLLEFAHNRVNSTIYICWGAMAGLYYHYGVEKIVLKNKIFGIFANQKLRTNDALFMGCDDMIYMPQSRHCRLDEVKIKKNPELCVLCECPETGVGIIKSIDNKKIFITGHLEYDSNTLGDEYERDKRQGGLEPKNYFRENRKIIVNWRGGASLVFSNWLNYYVYQATPYNLN